MPLPALPVPVSRPGLSGSGLHRSTTSSALREWPTWLLIAGCPLAWLGLVFGHDAIGPLWVVPAVLLVTLHSSLQHELLHGHPTASRRVNEALGFPALGLFVPYRRFRALHIAHHRDERLTDPYDDPESWYLSHDAWRRAGPVTRALLRANATLAGRVTVGPALALAGFWRSDVRRLRAGEPGVRRAWLVHALALVPVLGALAVAGVHPASYALAVAYPAMSVLMVRTFVEHRAAEAVPERTAVVEAGPLASLLFLNNNLHAVHHREPSRSWFELPARWRATRGQVLAANGANHVPDGYAGVARRWLLQAREPVVHPFAERRHHRGPATSTQARPCPHPPPLQAPPSVPSSGTRTSTSARTRSSAASIPTASTAASPAS